MQEQAVWLVVWRGVQEQVQVQGGHRERFNPPFLVCVGFLLLQRSLALVVGGCGTGAGSGSKHPAVTVLGGVRFLVLKPSCGNMHTWSLCLRWLWGRAVQEQVQVQVQDVWLAV